ncbi:hypothetical protein GSI_14439 [Ganoderma sinense ZZ0214-1]|uniref:Uncharacterized protein n=1 Tax=Ganoderma sinense ZZ0214-1 TaxID=1077348 RepID=A0A2G8RNQ3_9APHY|nr:hypothetical protein GSI_14439 [Ganoderma sinense ZZ0214-1]
MAHQAYRLTLTIPVPPATVPPNVALQDVLLPSGSDGFPPAPRDAEMTLVDSAVVVIVDAARPGSDTSILSFVRRSGGMMTTSDSGRGRGESSGGSSGGAATSPNKNNRGGTSHSALVNIVVPVVFVMVLVAFGVVFMRWLMRRLRRSRGRGAWSLFMRSEQKPQLYEVSLSTKGKDREGTSGWGSLQPASVDVIPGEERSRRKRSGQLDMGDVSTVGTCRHALDKKRYGRHRDFMVGKRIDLSGKDVVEVRVAVLVAMPSPSRSVRMRSSEAVVALPPAPELEEGLYIGTARASF